MQKIETLKNKSGEVIYPLTSTKAVVDENGNTIEGRLVVADGEDLVTDGNVLRLKDRPNTDGMGYVILRKDKTFAEQVTKPNTIYEIRYDFDLNGAEITIPEGCVLKFEGGSLRGGTVDFSNTYIEANKPIFENVTITGRLLNKFSELDWFADNTDKSGINLNNLARASKCIHINSDVTLKHPASLNNIELFIQQGRTIKVDAFVELAGNAVINGGTFLCNCPYQCIKISGSKNAVINCHFERHDEYSVNRIDSFIGIYHTSTDATVENCVFGGNCYYDVLVSGFGTKIYNCVFLSHRNDLPGAKCCAIKLHYDKSQNDADESAVGADYFVIQGCRFEYHTDNGIDTFTAGKNGIIRDCVFEESLEGSVEVKVAYRQLNDQGTSFPTGRYTENIKFVNNVFKSYVTIQTPVLDGVYDEIPKYAEYIYLEQNLFLTKGTSIFLNACEHIHITGNIFKVSKSDAADPLSNIISIQRTTNNIRIEHNFFNTNEQIISCRPNANLKNLWFAQNDIRIQEGYLRAALFNLSGDGLVFDANMIENKSSNAAGIIFYPYTGIIENIQITNNVFKQFKFIVEDMGNPSYHIKMLYATGNKVYGDKTYSFIDNNNGYPSLMVLKDNTIYAYGRYYYMKPGTKNVHDENNYMLNKSDQLEESLPNVGTTPPTPTTRAVETGLHFFNTEITKPIWWNGTEWVEADGSSAGVQRAGIWSQRPNADGSFLENGFQYFLLESEPDEDPDGNPIESITGNGKPIWWIQDGRKWVDATGATVTG